MPGFSPRATRKKSQPAGPVRGPGTGTSDDIETQVPQGSYIMPADSTAQMGADQLAAMGQGAPVPVNLSNGEYNLPPEQVHAIGAQALDAMRGATHTPVQKGFQPAVDEPELFFADGGLVDDEKRKKRRNASPSPTVPANGAGHGATGSWDEAAPAGSGIRGFLGPRAAAVASGLRQDLSDQWGKGQYARAAGTAVRGTLAGIPAEIVDDYHAHVAPAIDAIAGFGKGLLGIDDAASATETPPSTSTPAEQGTSTAPAQARNTSADGGATPVPQTAAPGLDNNVTRVGNSFSANGPIREGFTINGQQPRGALTVVPHLPTPAAAQAQVAQTPTAATTNTGASGFNPGLSFETQNQIEKARRTALKAASTPYKGSQNGQLTARQIAALQGFTQSQDRLATSRANTQAQQRGATQRTAMQETGRNSRFAASNALEKQRTAADLTAKGFQNEMARRLESLYQQYEAAALPDEKSAIAEQIRVLSGQGNPNRFKVVPPKQIIDPVSGQLVTTPAMSFDQQSGRARVITPQDGGGARAPQVGEERGGYRYKGGDPADPNSWERI